MNNNLRDEKSDEMFVQWSLGRVKDSWDVRAVAEIVNRRGLRKGLDIGGGIGTFANALLENCEHVERIDVVDPSLSAANAFQKNSRVNLIQASIQDFEPQEKYDFITINLVLHHIVANSDHLVKTNQTHVIAKAKSLLAPNGLLIVEENVYDSVFTTDLTGRLIFEITKLKSIESITRKLGANTAGEGVRFRSERSWKALFEQQNLREVEVIYNKNWGQNMPVWQKIPLLCTRRFQKITALEEQQ